MVRTNVRIALCLLLICCAASLVAQPSASSETVPGAPPAGQCAYNFTTGSGNTFLNYCVTVAGNIPQIVTPAGIEMIASNGEGYGVCNESPAQNYDDWTVSNTGNWNVPVLLSHTSTSVKIARTTSDGNWTLTQTISTTRTPSITVVMALRNNQSTDHVAYLVRFADAEPAGYYGQIALAGLNGAVSWNQQSAEPNYGLLLQNVGPPPFGYLQGIVQNVTTGPNSCAFAFNDHFGGVGGTSKWLLNLGPASIELAYAGVVKAGKTNTVTLTYRGL